DYQGALVIDQRDQLKLTVSSTLQGISVDLPAPLTKPAQAAWPLRVQWTEAVGQKQAHELHATLAERAELIAEFGSASEGGQQVAPMRAAIGVDRRASLPPAGFHAEIRAAELDLDAWREVVETFQPPPSATPSRLPLADIAGA